MSHIPPAIARDFDFRARCQDQLRQVDLQLAKCQTMMEDLSMVAATQPVINTHYPSISSVPNVIPKLHESLPDVVLPQEMPQPESPWRCNYTLYPIPEEDIDSEMEN